jgi:hypothetical protein
MILIFLAKLNKGDKLVPFRPPPYMTGEHRVRQVARCERPERASQSLHSPSPADAMSPSHRRVAEQVRAERASQSLHSPSTADALSCNHVRATAYKHRGAAAADELHVPTNLYSLSNKEMFALKQHVASVCFKCLKCFRVMLQVFCTDIAKVDHDIAHVAMVVHVCCKLLFSMFHLFFFLTCVASVFIWMLYIFSYIRCKCFI